MLCDVTAPGSEAAGGNTEKKNFFPSLLIGRPNNDEGTERYMQSYNSV